MKTLNENYVSAGKVCLEVDITLDTLYRWYRWWENDNFPKPEGLYLPPYYHKDRRKTKFFKKEEPVLEGAADEVETLEEGAEAEEVAEEVVTAEDSFEVPAEAVIANADQMEA